MRRLTTIGAAVCCGIFSISLASGAVVTDPTLHSGANAIDPSGSRDVDRLFSNFATEIDAAKTGLEGISGFAVLQDWTGFQRYYSHPTNIVHFSDPNRPDVQFTVLASAGVSSDSTGMSTSSASYATSGTSAYWLSGKSNPGTFQVEIDFGKYDSTQATWNGAVASPNAVGFTIANQLTKTSITIQAQFYSPDGTLLMDETTDNTSTAHFLFAYKGDGTAAQSVSRIVLTRTALNSSSSSEGLDDFGYTLVPEPASGMLMGLAAAGLLFRRRR